SSAATRHGPVVAAELLSRAPAPAFDAATRVAYTWAGSDASAAADWAVKLADPQVRLASVQAVLQAWGESDLAGASTWARGISDSALRERALSYVCSRAPEAPLCG